jgi:hypothetical protein
MRQSPSIVPETFDCDVYLVLNNFGYLGRAWTESDEQNTDRETVMRDLFHGQYSDPVRVVAFNTAQGWSRDVSEEIANELAKRLANERDEVPLALEAFLERYGGHRCWGIDERGQLLELSKGQTELVCPARMSPSERGSGVGSCYARRWTVAAL